MPSSAPPRPVVIVGRSLPSPTARVPLGGERNSSALSTRLGPLPGRSDAAPHLRAPLPLADPAVHRPSAPVRDRPHPTWLGGRSARRAVRRRARGGGRGGGSPG